MPDETFRALLGAGLPGADQQLVLELVFADPLSPDAVAARITEAVPGAQVTVEGVFDEERDKFFFAEFPQVRVDGQEPQVFAFARALRPAVEAVEINPVLPDGLYGAVSADATTTESFGLSCETPRNDSLPWGWVHPVIKTIDAWRRTRGSGATVAVIDTGYSSHQELSGAIRTNGQANFVEGGTDASDRFTQGFLQHPGHGTLVCSVVASRGQADASGNTSGHGGITGSAPEAKVLPIRAIESVIKFSQRTIPKAIAHATNQGVDVISMALGGPVRVAATEKALRDAVDAGVVVVCAAGNCWPWVVFPAAYAPSGLCTAVAALTHNLTPWDKTGKGRAVTLSAPGENVWGAAKNKATDPDHGIKPAQGTTLATSLTAGVAALWMAHHGGRAAQKARADAANTTVQAMWVHCATSGLSKPSVWGGSNKLGAGVLDADLALSTPLPAAATGNEAATIADLPAAGVDSTANILLTHLSETDPDAAAEFDPSLADYAPELLWRSYRAGAKQRAAAALGTEAAISADPVSPSLSAALTGKPALQRAVGAP